MNDRAKQSNMNARYVIMRVTPGPMQSDPVHRSCAHRLDQSLGIHFPCRNSYQSPCLFFGAVRNSHIGSRYAVTLGHLSYFPGIRAEITQAIRYTHTQFRISSNNNSLKFPVARLGSMRKLQHQPTGRPGRGTLLTSCCKRRDASSVPPNKSSHKSTGNCSQQ